MSKIGLLVLLAALACAEGLRCYKCNYREFDPSNISQPECLTGPKEEWLVDVPDINPPDKPKPQPGQKPDEEPPYWYAYCRVVTGGVEGRRSHDRSYAYRVDDVGAGPHCESFNMTDYVATYCYCNTDGCNNF